MKRFFLMLSLFVALGLLTVSCNKNPGEIYGDGPEGTELGDGPEGNEGNGEGNGEGSGEGNGEGGEGSGGEGGNESGTLWNIADTADETVNGLRLIISYDSATQTFTGTLENLNSTTMPQTRFEVHVFDAAGNSTEYGPSTPVDMAPGETRNVSLQVTGAQNFVQFNMHPEFG